ncbi:MAG: flavin-containing monooxygenase [Haloarculaceae archaeon]
MTNDWTTDATDGPDLDAVVVGAGFSGMYMLHRLRELGLSARVYEKADDIGGTWYWNRYPGARCDSESHIYCYSFDDDLLDEWEWSERYPRQPEILEYLRFAADHLDLRRDIQFETEIETAAFDQERGTWAVTTDDGDRVTARFFVTAVGCLSDPFVPDFDGLDTFDGEWYHTARWPHDGVDLDGERVGVVGTGSTGIQLIPVVADRAGHLTVFQRTPNYAVPAQNRPLEPGEYEDIKERYDEIWAQARETSLGMPIPYKHDSVEDLTDAEVEAALEERWQKGGFWFTRTFEDLLTNEATNEVVAEFIREKIREDVDDPEVTEKLVPTDHPYGTKRPPMNYDDYYGTYDREDVRLVDVDADPIAAITPDGVLTEAGTGYDLDVLVFATGFDAMTGALLEMDIRGRDGRSLAAKWADGPRTYLGLGVHGFPNMFTITGPQSPSVLTNMPQSIEQHVDWITDCLIYMREHGHRFVEPTEAAEDQWVAHTNEAASESLMSEADSWYRGANVPGKPEVFTPYPGGLDVYRDLCDGVAANDYEGFELTDSLDSLPA